MTASPRHGKPPLPPPLEENPCHPSQPLSGFATSPLLGKGFALRAREGENTSEDINS